MSAPVYLRVTLIETARREVYQPAFASENSSDREVHPALTGWTHAARQADGSDDRVSNDSEIECSSHRDRSGIERGSAEGSAGLVPSAPVDSSSHQLGQAVKFAPEAKRRIGIVVAKKLLWKIRSQAEGSAERKNLKWPRRSAEGRAARDVEEERSQAPDGNKISRLQIELPDGMRLPRTLQHTRERSNDAAAAAGNRRTVLSVPYITRSEFTGAAVDDGQACGSDQRA